MDLGYNGFPESEDYINYLAYFVAYLMNRHLIDLFPCKSVFIVTLRKLDIYIEWMYAQSINTNTATNKQGWGSSSPIGFSCHGNLMSLCQGHGCMHSQQVLMTIDQRFEYNRPRLHQLGWHDKLLCLGLGTSRGINTKQLFFAYCSTP